MGYMVVYRLMHCIGWSPYGWNENSIMIGYFDSETKCWETIRSLLPMPGYCDHPDSFRVFIDRLPDIKGNSLPDTVFEVTSERITDEANYVAYESFLGVYAHERSAMNRIAKCEKRMKNSKQKTVFYCTPYAVNEVHWREGFDMYTWTWKEHQE